MTTTTHTAATTAPAISAEISALMDDLTGFHPALDRVIAALGDLLEADLTAAQSQSVIAALGGYAEGNVATLLALTVRRIADPDANAALTGLPTERKQTLRRLGAEYAAGADDPEQQALASEASAAIDGV
jgi:hypothetical protein